MKMAGRILVASVCGGLAGITAAQFLGAGLSPWLILLPVGMVVCMFVYGTLSWGWD